MVIQNAINNLITSQAANRVYGVARRQCISASNNIFITSITGFNVTIAGSASQPIVCTFAVGSDVLGIPIDYVGVFASNQSFTALTANTTHFFYLERNTITGALTCNKIIIVPIYSATAPASPVTGQHWFKTFTDSLTSQPGYTMYEWSGSAWVVRQRVFIAEVTTGASGVTSFANYANNRRYESDWVSWSGETIYAAGHNLGIPLSGATWSFVGRASASDTTENLCPQSIAATNYGVFPFGAGTRLNQPFLTGNGGVYFNGTNWVGAGQIKGTIQINW